MRGKVSVSSVEGTTSAGKRDRNLESAQTLSERRNLHVHLEQKAELAVQGECAAQKRLSEAETEVDICIWKQRNSDLALYDTNRELETQRLELHQANQWADQAQREKINLSGESDMRDILFRETRARNCQEIEELRRICCEETDRARQLRIDELSLQQERCSLVGGVAQVVCHGVIVVVGHGQEEEREKQGEVEGEVEESQGQPHIMDGMEMG